MKILVPTDFSLCAQYAEEFALEWAKKTKSELHFIHIMDVPADWLTRPDSNNQVYSEVNGKVNNANNYLDGLISQVAGFDITAFKHLVYNKSYRYITQFVIDNHIDFVIMGSHGASGIRELLVGSYAQKVVRLSKAPVMVIKNQISINDIENILFAADFEESVQEEFDKIISFARQIGAKLHLVFINTPFNFNDTLSIKTKMGNYALRAPGIVESMEIFNGIDVEQGLQDYAKDKDFDVFSMITHGRTGFSRIFSGSITESVINHFQEPVLSLNMISKNHQD